MENVNPATRGDTAEMIGISGRIKTSAAHAEWTVKENFRQIWSLLRKISDIENQKGNPQERIGVLKFSPNGQGVWNKPCLKKPMGRSHMHQKAGVNYMGGESALLTNPK